MYTIIQTIPHTLYLAHIGIYSKSTSAKSQAIILVRKKRINLAGILAKRNAPKLMPTFGAKIAKALYGIPRIGPVIIATIPFSFKLNSTLSSIFLPIAGIRLTNL